MAIDIESLIQANLKFFQKSNIKVGTSQATEQKEDVTVSKQYGTEQKQDQTINKQYATEQKDNLTISKQYSIEEKQKQIIQQAPELEEKQNQTISKQYTTEQKQSQTISKQYDTEQKNDVIVGKQQTTEQKQRIYVSNQYAKEEKQDIIIQNETQERFLNPYNDTKTNSVSIVPTTDFFENQVETIKSNMYNDQTNIEINTRLENKENVYIQQAPNTEEKQDQVIQQAPELEEKQTIDIQQTPNTEEKQTIDIQQTPNTEEKQTIDISTATGIEEKQYQVIQQIPELEEKKIKEITFKNSFEEKGIDESNQEKINKILGNTRDQLSNIKNIRPGEIGFLYVKPVSTSNFLPFKIPFQFNPKINENSMQAKYNAITYLARIGEVQNFTGVSSLNLTISTEYHILSSGESSDEVDYWMNFYTLDALDKIEMAYRSLILPNFMIESKSTYYVRPPSIKIIMGDENLLNTQKNNINYDNGQFEFAYPSYPNNVSDLYKANNLLASQTTSQNLSMQFHKMFVATGVTINKDFESDIYFVKNGINRMSGFTVELSLVEVTEDYMDLMPDYKVYYEFYKGMGIPIQGGITNGNK